MWQRNDITLKWGKYFLSIHLVADTSHHGLENKLRQRNFNLIFSQLIRRNIQNLSGGQDANLRN
jgi:hypothetical protein